MAIDRKAAKEFAKRWSGQKWSEDQNARTFWMDLLQNVYGIEYNDTNNVIFEHRTSANGKIDLWLRNLATMVEMKGSDVDLDKPEPRQGELKTPFKQVYDYAVSFKRSEQPDYLITCNFHEFRVYSRKEYSDKVLEENAQIFSLEQLGEKPEYLGFLIDPQNSRLYHEREISEKAGQLIGKLYDMLRAQYIDPDTEESNHSLNVLCVRLVFCLFCEDAGLFGEMDAFYNFLKDVPSQNIRNDLQRLFTALDTPRDKRDPYDTPIKVFPYVNGGLFRDTVEIPNFTDDIKSFLLDELSQSVDWSKISPTIFGGIFESTLNPETRRKGGMHYTSRENIHKVIDPLFLDDLKKEFEDIRDDEELSVVKKNNRYKKLHHKICNLTFLDPAAGSGNFLTETYICLRQLEFAIISELKRGKNIGMFDSALEGDVEERVKLSQFYGIEINDFAVAVAETALWISRLKANQEAIIVFDLDEKDFPLEERANIICKNALRFDWKDLVEPSELSYIMGNPPFVGYSFQTREQKADITSIYIDENGCVYSTAGEIDYVAGWFFKASHFMQDTTIRAAFVSTNSITQGEQVAYVWKPIFDRFYVHFDFAYRSFVWDSATSDKAQVHCVIIGFSISPNNKKRVLFEADKKQDVSHINAYLLDAPDVFIENRTRPLFPVSLMTNGNKPADGGFLLLSREERDELISEEPIADRFIRRMYGASEYINNKERYCLWLQGVDASELIGAPRVMARINSVKDFREKSTKEATRKSAKTPMLFQQIRQPKSDYIIVPRVSSENRQYVPMGYMSSEIIVTDSVQFIPNAKLYEFGVITSLIHMIWLRAIGGRLKSDYRYSAKNVYNNFPWCSPTDEQKDRIELTAQGILDARENYPDKSLADLYDPDKMPPELKLAHEANDRAVMDAYGFSYDMTEPEIVAELMKMYQELTKEG